MSSAHNYDHTGSWFNITLSSYQYRKSHCGDKTAVRSSYLHNSLGISGSPLTFDVAPESIQGNTDRYGAHDLQIKKVIRCLKKVAWNIPDSKVHGANMGPIWGRQDPGGPHVGPMNFAIWDDNLYTISHRSQHLRYHDWCKLVTWCNFYSHNISKEKFTLFTY